MKKATAKYLISICVLLLSVSTQLAANTHRKSSFRANQYSENTNSHSHLQELSCNTNSIKNRIRILLNGEIEEEKNYLVSYKRYSSNTFCYSTLFYSCLNRFLYLKNPQFIQIGNQFLKYSYHSLFIIFGVFRI